MKIWFTSDTHFSHKNIIKYCKRPFGGIDHMNMILIQNWNEVVGPDDLVWHLGDVAMGNRRHIPGYREKLNGRIHLVQGNHDYGKQLSCFDEVHKSAVIELDGIKVELVHEPRKVQGLGDVAFAGHVHDKWVIMTKGTTVPEYKAHDHFDAEFTAPVDIFNVGVDVRGFRPVSLTQVLDRE
jgi:calcineurin-like phosphoesterase family protein